MSLRPASRASATPSPLQQFLTDLQRLPIPPDARAAVLRLMRGFVGQRLYVTARDLVQPERINHAHTLLQAGFTATDTRRRMVERYGVSPDTAEKLVTLALGRRITR